MANNGPRERFCHPCLCLRFLRQVPRDLPAPPLPRDNLVDCLERWRSGVKRVTVGGAGGAGSVVDGASIERRGAAAALPKDIRPPQEGLGASLIETDCSPPSQAATSGCVFNQDRASRLVRHQHKSLRLVGHKGVNGLASTDPMTRGVVVEDQQPAWWKTRIEESQPREHRIMEVTI
jgi:hypothetical protein